MPRSSYFQEFGNPLRRELLPRRQMSLAFAVPEVSSAVHFAAIIGLALFIICADILDHVLAAVAPAGTVDPCRGAFVAIGSLFVMFRFVKKCCSPEWRAFCFPLAFGLPLVAGITIVWSESKSYLALQAGFVACCYIHLFSQHWCRLCVTTPFSQTTARRLLAKWNAWTLHASLVPLVLALVAWLINPLAASCLMVSLGIVCLVSLSSYAHWRNWCNAWQALGSWLTYPHPSSNVPGLYSSPSGDVAIRTALSFWACLIIAFCLREVFQWPLVVSPLVALVMPLILMQPVLAEAASCRQEFAADVAWTSVIKDLRTSANPIERKSYYMTRVAADMSPVLVPRSVFREHAHFLGDSGSGKTSLGLAPFIEQSIQFGDASVIVIDLKADTLELMATMVAAAERLRREREIHLPLKYLTTRDDLSTFAFNPLMQPFWHSFNSYKKTDLLAGATGLQYGPNFGEAFYSSANEGVLNHTHKLYPDVQTFDELAERCGYVLESAHPEDLHKEMKRNGAHVHEVLKRLASFAPLNVAPGGKYAAEVVEQSIDLADVFRRPQLLYFHLSSTLGPGSAPALARFVCYLLLASAVHVDRSTPVFLVIDEFQRMVSRNFEYMLQLARSMGVGIVLANQSMEDLNSGSTKLIPTIEANCRYRQWFAVSSSADRERLAHSSGETVEYFTTRGSSTNSNGGSSSSISITERIMPRLSANDIMLASDHPKQSIVRISRGDGYAQYGGLPFVCESDFHITKDEYERRRRTRWPNREYGTFIPDEHENRQPEREPDGPVVTTEVIGQADSDESDDPFANLPTDFRGDGPSKRKNRRGGR